MRRLDGATHGMLYDNEVPFIFIWDAEIPQESISRLAHDHGAEELAAKPSSTSGGDGSLNDGDLEIGASLAKHVGSAETAGSGTNDDNIGLGISVKVLEVAAGHGARDLGLADGSEREALLPLVGHLLEGLSLAVIDKNWFDIEARLQGDAIDGGGELREHCRRWCHFDCLLRSRYEPSLG